MISLNFNILEYKNSELSQISYKIFECLNFNEALNINDETLKRLIQNMAKNYNILGYHNFSHAFSLFQMICHTYFISEFKNFVSPANLFAALISGLAHDMNHSKIFIFEQW